MRCYGDKPRDYTAKVSITLLLGIPCLAACRLMVLVHSSDQCLSISETLPWSDASFVQLTLLLSHPHVHLAHLRTTWLLDNQFPIISSLDFV